MKKRILIISNDKGLSGVKIDIENYKIFFQGSYGGKWNNDEIIEKHNTSKTDLILELENLKNMSLDYLIVIFSGHGGYDRYKRGTLLELNSNEYILENDLKNLAVRQLNIYDCCRICPRIEIRNLVNSLIIKNTSLIDINIRERYEKRIMQSIPQQIYLYACEIDEYAYDTSEGGNYSKHLIQCFLNIENEYKLISVAHQEASKLTTNKHPDQHPVISDLPRCLSSQQLIISIKP